MFIEHEKDVEKIRQELLATPRNTTLHNSSSPSNITRSNAYKSQGTHLNINHLNRILKIDTASNRIIVEPRVTMEQLAQAALKHHRMVPVIPEFKGITVGGAIQGTGLESSSHRFGLFSDSCLAYEILLGNGEIIRATREEHADLFYGIVGSYGSLGIILSVELPLIPAEPWVRLHYKTFHSVEDCSRYLQQENSADFVEGIVYAPDHIQIIEGRSSPSNTSLPQLSPKPWSRWFYHHAKEIQHGHEEMMPLIDYLFRHDRGAFWIGAYGTYPLAMVRYFVEKRLNSKFLTRILPQFDPANFQGLRDPGWFFRFLCGWAMTSRRLYSWLHAHAEDWIAKRMIIQDFFIPSEQLVSFVKTVSQEIQIFPLWLCPIRSTQAPQIFSPHFSASPKLVNVGIYGAPQATELAQNLLPKIEAQAHAANGRKMLYSHSRYSPEKFWEIYSEPQYRKLRQTYHADRWMSIEKKVLQG